MRNKTIYILSIFCAGFVFLYAKPALAENEDIENMFVTEKFQPRSAFYEDVERTFKKDIEVNKVNYEVRNPRVSYEEYIGRMFTKGRANGNYVVEFIERSQSGASKVRTYIYAVLDTLTEIKMEALKIFYPDATFEDVVEHVVKYYKNNPASRQRTVVDVILSGCK